MNDLEKRIADKDTKKKILACDGGGIRGLMTVEMLAKMEDDLRTAMGRGPGFVLADYFDYVCGTSTGAIIAACISMGMPMARVRKFYEESGRQMFDKASLLRRLRYKYEDEPLAQKLREEIGADTTLGSTKLRTLLMMVLRNATTDSPWPISNNPAARYNDTTRDDCNLKLPLWKLVRASTAAPTYFPPEVVTFGDPSGKSYDFIFVDGGVTAYNNPAFLAFQTVTASPYQINWATSADKLLIVSVGTGGSSLANAALKAGDMNLLYNATSIPSALMNAASAGWDMACRTMGACRYGEPIDREFGALLSGPPALTPNATVPKLFTYMRYNPELSAEGLAALGLGGIKPADVQQLDSIDHMGDMQKVGVAYARKAISIQHFDGFLA